MLDVAASPASVVRPRRREIGDEVIALPGVPGVHATRIEVYLGLRDAGADHVEADIIAFGPAARVVAGVEAHPHGRAIVADVARGAFRGLAAYAAETVR